MAHLGAAGQHTYFVSDPDGVREMLVSRGRQLDKGQALRGASIVLGDGLLTAAREKHRPRRRLVAPAFAHARLAGYADTMIEVAQRTAERWTEGASVHMSDEMSSMTLDIIGRTILGTDLSPYADQVNRSLTEALKGWERMLVPGGEQYNKLPLLPAPVRFRAAAADLHSIVRGLIAGVPADSHDIVGVLRRARDDGVALDAEGLHDETMTLMLAGHETTANLLTWAFFLLSEYPQEAALLREELRDALGDRPAGYADLPQLHRLHAVVAETLRLFPPAWVLEREALERLEIDGWPVPVGATLLTSQFAMHRDPRWWPDGDEFVPSRWLDADGRFSEDQPGVPRGAWFPFGAGTRICIGEQFAWVEAELALAVFVRRWAPARVAGRPVALRAAVTLRPLDGMPMRLARSPVPARS
jgi:cytochrome P450